MMRTNEQKTSGETRFRLSKSIKIKFWINLHKIYHIFMFQQNWWHFLYHFSFFLICCFQLNWNHKLFKNPGEVEGPWQGAWLLFQRSENDSDKRCPNLILQTVTGSEASNLQLIKSSERVRWGHRTHCRDSPECLELSIVQKIQSENFNNKLLGNI